MDDLVYPGPLEVRTKDGETQLRGAPFGPAGVSSVEFPDGTCWEVDHADPSRVVLVSVDGDLDRSFLLRELLGQERFDLACAQLGAQRAAKPSGARLRADVRIADGTGLTSGPPLGWPGADSSVGAAILAVDAAGNDSELPLVRVAAGVEFLSMVTRGAPLRILGPLTAQVVSGLAVTARVVGPEDLENLPAGSEKSLHRLESMLRQALREHAELELPFRGLLDLLRSAARGGRAGRAAGLGAELAVSRLLDLRSSESSTTFWEPGGAEPLGSEVHAEDFVDVSVDGPGQVVVRTARLHSGKWVRVLRLDGLVPLALVPLLPDGLVLEALAVVPPELSLGEMVVQLVDPGELVGLQRPLDLVRAAVEAGRTAARYWRLEQFQESSEAWTECSRLWRAAGDDSRAGEARERAASLPSWNRFPPQRTLLGDELGSGSD